MRRDRTLVTPTCHQRNHGSASMTKHTKKHCRPGTSSTAIFGSSTTIRAETRCGHALDSVFFGGRTGGSTGERRGARQTSCRAPIPAPYSAGTKPQNLGGSGPKQKPRRGDPAGFEVSQFGQPGDRGGPRAVQLAIYH